MSGYIFVFLVALAAGGVSGLIGTGSSLILLPVLVQSYGPKAAIPIMAVAAILGNLSRIGVWWRLVDWRAASAYAISGVPAAALGAHTLLALPSHFLDIVLGLFFWSMIFIRRRLQKAQWRLSLFQLGLCGAVIGFMTGLVLSTGPMSVPAFTAYGLSGGAFLGTEAASAALLYLGKVGTFAVQGALTKVTVLKGLFVGVGMMIGTAGSKALVMRMPARHFDLALDFLLFASGGALIGQIWIGSHSL